jgi:hypothetical protein
MAAAALALSGAACGSSGGPAAPSHPPCVKPSEGIGPDAYGTLQDQDAGKTVCLPAGKELTVFLKVADINGPRWSPIQVSDQTVLEPGNVGIMTLVRGVTGGIFNARRLGTARLSSQLAACGSSPSSSPTSGPTAGCDALQSWSATVVVTAK